MDWLFGVVIFCVVVLILNVARYVLNWLNTDGPVLGSLLGMKSNTVDLVVSVLGAVGVGAMVGLINLGAYGFSRRVQVL
jgi:hypothetical protein